METAQKKEIKKDYQQKKTIGGIYAIQNTKTNKWFIKESYNIVASKNLFDFSLKINHFEVLEELEKGEEQTRKAFGEDLKELLQIWLEKLQHKTLY